MSWKPPVYDWQKEYYAWAQSQPKVPSRMMTHAEWRRLYLRPKMSNLLAVTYQILDTPEIWDRFVEFVRRENSDNPNYVDADGEPASWSGDDAEFRYACQLVHDYYCWFQMKRGLVDDDPNPYGSIPGTILQTAQGKIDRADLGSIKNSLINHADRTEIDETPEFGEKS